MEIIHHRLIKTLPLAAVNLLKANFFLRSTVFIWLCVTEVFVFERNPLVSYVSLPLLCHLGHRVHLVTEELLDDPRLSEPDNDPADGRGQHVVLGEAEADVERSWTLSADVHVGLTLSAVV